jgi:hypothetical protein
MNIWRLANSKEGVITMAYMRDIAALISITVFVASVGVVSESMRLFV